MRARKRLLPLSLIVLMAVVVVAGCDDDTTAPPATFAPPSDLSFINGEDQITLSWTATPDEARGDFAGYNVYRDTTSMGGLTGTDLDARRVNQVPQSNRTYFDGNVVIGTRYYYAVRAVTDDDELSEPTSEVNTAARPEDSGVVIAEFSDPQRPSGFDLSDGAAFMMSSDNPDNRPFIDLYLGTLDINDASSSDTLAIKSPSLVLGGSSAWSNRVAGFKLLEDFDVSSSTASGWQDTIVLGAEASEIVGTVIAVRAPADDMGETHYGKIEILSLDGLVGERRVNLRWTYQPIPNYIRF